MICGVAYHHAGMEVSDRKTIETAFNTGDIPVLCEYKNLTITAIITMLMRLFVKNIFICEKPIHVERLPTSNDGKLVAGVGKLVGGTGWAGGGMKFPLP